MNKIEFIILDKSSYLLTKGKNQKVYRYSEGEKKMQRIIQWLKRMFPTNDVEYLSGKKK
tara:strand:+ start:5504 stop:5680 length:177 start_codon:yes stop_codon:yes gene_type:complete